MVTIKDGCGCDPCDCDWKQKLKEAYSRAIQSVNKIGDETGRVYYPDGTGFVKVPLPTKEQVDSLAEIDGIKASVDELNKTVPALETQVTGVTESLVSDVEVLNGTTAGKFKVRIEREKASVIDSNDYDLSKVNSIELIQGSGPAMVKAQLTLSDGTVLRSDDFLFTSESIGTDVYISSFTFKNGNVDGTISADIGLNNGTTLEANNFVVPTDPSVVSTITDLQTRMSAVESGSGVTGLDALKTTVDTHTSEIAQLTNDVGGLMTSKVNVSQGTENAGKALVIGTDGNVTPGEISGGGKELIVTPDNLISIFDNVEVGDTLVGQRLEFYESTTLRCTMVEFTLFCYFKSDNVCGFTGLFGQIFTGSTIAYRANGSFVITKSANLFNVNAIGTDDTNTTTLKSYSNGFVNSTLTPTNSYIIKY